MGLFQTLRNDLQLSGDGPEEWKSVKRAAVAQYPSGRHLLQLYNGSLLLALSSAAPHHFWYGTIRAERGHWDQLDHQRQFMEVQISSPIF